MKVSFLVRPDLERWSCDHGSFLSGERHEIANAKAGLVSQVAAAESAGALVDVSYDEEAKKVAGKAVESDAESLKKLEKAQADGSWQEGNLLQWELDQKARAGSES